MPVSLPGRLGVAHPVFQAPMAGGWTTPALVSAVSNVGGLGSLAGARLTAREIRDQIEETRRPTERPFAINLQIPTVPPEDLGGGLEHPVLETVRRRLGTRGPAVPPTPFATADEGVDLAIEAGVPIVSFAMGSPAPYVGRLHAAGIFVIGSATTVAEALEVEAAGADADTPHWHDRAGPSGC